jgi:lipoprotein-anchoring transpeptidase ErfK/SrfK
VSKGRHAKRSWRGGKLPVLLILVVVTLIAIGGTAFAAITYDRDNAERILPGVNVAGVDVSGMTRAEAIQAVRDRAELTLASRVRVSASDLKWNVTPSELGMHADVRGAVSKAMAVTDSFGFFSRVYHRVTSEPVDEGFRLTFPTNKTKVESFVGEVSNEVAEPSRDADVLLEDGEVAFRHSAVGRALDAEPAVAEVRAALKEHTNSVKLGTHKVEPKVSDQDLGYTIVVSRPENKLYLYKGFEVVKTYGIATAAKGYVTPPGTWSIVNKAENPTWTNPAPNGWGAGSPAVIPPGPGNPLGTRALYLDAPGIRIHGTYSDDSIGTYASHGCIRMHISDSEELYGIVPIGTTVLIV